MVGRDSYALEVKAVFRHGCVLVYGMGPNELTMGPGLGVYATALTLLSESFLETVARGQDVTALALFPRV